MASYLDRRLASPPTLAPATRAGWARSAGWANPFRAGLALLYGHPQTVRLAHYFLAPPLLAGETILFLDAANSFNPYWLTAVARCLGRTHRAGEFLRQVRISRAFTCYQLAALIERTAGGLASGQARWVFLTGFPDIFDDDDVPRAEAERVLEQSLLRLERLARRAAVWVFSDPAAGSEARRMRLRAPLLRRAARVYRVEETEAGLEWQEESRISGPVCRRAPAEIRGKGGGG